MWAVASHEIYGNALQPQSCKMVCINIQIVFVSHLFMALHTLFYDLTYTLLHMSEKLDAEQTSGPKWPVSRLHLPKSSMMGLSKVILKAYWVSLSQVLRM